MKVATLEFCGIAPLHLSVSCVHFFSNCRSQMYCCCAKLCALFPVAEVDYLAEAKNTIEFSAAMERRGLNAVTAPAVVSELSTSKILVTEWVEGTRLDRDASTDVPRLCGVAINAYLTMLLDTGTLHCDPHPGNRT